MLGRWRCFVETDDPTDTVLDVVVTSVDDLLDAASDVIALALLEIVVLERVVTNEDVLDDVRSWVVSLVVDFIISRAVK